MEKEMTESKKICAVIHADCHDYQIKDLTYDEMLKIIKEIVGEVIDDIRHYDGVYQTGAMDDIVEEHFPDAEKTYEGEWFEYEYMFCLDLGFPDRTKVEYKVLHNDEYEVPAS